MADGGKGGALSANAALAAALAAAVAAAIAALVVAPSVAAALAALAALARRRRPRHRLTAHAEEVLSKIIDGTAV